MRILLLIILWGMSNLCLAQPRQLAAVKTSKAPVIDGNLNDAAWKLAPVASDFVQNYPNRGEKESTRTEFRILYDDDAVYVSAYLFEDPSLIRKQITARDAEERQDVDFMAVYLDTYSDHQNCFQFLTTSANVQTDVRVGSNEGDRTWDAVWESKVQFQPDGWTVEMRIPYLSLRFSKKDVQTWGLQFQRFTRRTNESSFWNFVDPNVNGLVNQFGQWTDLKNIVPPLRLSFSPYLSGGVRANPEGSSESTRWLRSGGMDVKYGINESFTLDATLIPDFGQVVSDNLINNLSPFEIRFQENRPFFTEGTELFNKAGLFYSRRIGATPAGYNRVNNFIGDHSAEYQLLRNPSITQLYNGIKFSGRTKSNLGIGVFNALTAPENAKLRNLTTSSDTVIRTEPLSNYNIIVLDQALRGQSSITFTNTNVIRSGSSRDANVSALNWALFSKNNVYGFSGAVRYGKIFGYTPYTGNINLIYDTVFRDGTYMVRPYDGFNTSVTAGKVSGKLQYEIGQEVTSHTYDPNDLGYLESPNAVDYNASISYNEFNPTKHFISYRYELSATSSYLYKPYKFAELELNASAMWVFKNFWDVTLYANSYPVKQRDFFDLRTAGRFFNRPAELTTGIEGSSDSRRKLFVYYSLEYSFRDAHDNGYNRVTLETRYRFSNRFSLTLRTFRQFENNQRGYAFIRETNDDPIAGYRNYTDLDNTLTGIYNFTPRLNLRLRARHYWNRVHYNRYFNIDGKGDFVSRAFISDQDENYNVFSLDAFLTWDFRLGSRLIVGWKNWLGDSYSLSEAARYKNYFNNLSNIFDSSHGNELSIKLIYFLDYNQLRRKSHSRH